MYESKTMAVAAPEALTQPALSIMEPSSSLKKGRRTAPDEVWEGPTDEEEYKQYLEFRRKTDWREPYRIPQRYFIGTKKFVGVSRPDTPLIAFINARSGGQVGPRLASILYRSLGQAQVFDVSETRPHDVLSTLWANLNAAEAKGDTKASYIRNNLRILVAGGDGSATWVLGTIRELGLTPPPPVAVMPLGTGNDLSINLGWGSEFTWAWVKPDELYATLERYKNGEVCPIDVWQASITAPDATYYDAMPHSLQQDPENPRTANASFWNYFSVGLDAEAAYGFHSLREAHPRLAASRLTNQAWYGFFSCATGWFCGAPPISATLKLRVKDAPDSEWRSLVVPNSVRAIILLNLQTYGGGRDVWGLADSVGMRKQGFSEPRFNDGAIEVVGLLNGWHSALVMGQLSSKLHALRLAQCCEVELELASTRSRVKDDEATVYMQLDGEPWPQRIPAASLQRSPAVAGEGIKSSEPLRVHIASPGQSQMLLNTSNVLGSRKVKQLAKRNIDRVHSKAVNSNGADGGGAR